MLCRLCVKNLAIVESVEVLFGDGLNIITGETGSGKSVLMGALNLVLGGRADKSVIREGEKQATVEAVFQLPECRIAPIDALLTGLDLPPCEDGSLLVRRSVSQTGAGRCFVNDTSVSAATLRQLGELLVDIHGAYDHQSLLSSDYQRDFLDAYGCCASALSAYRETWRQLQERKTKLAALQGDSSDIAMEIDRLQYMVDEIASANLTEADGEELVERHDQAANAEQILAIGQSVSELINESEASVFNQLVAAQQQLTELARILPAAAEWRKDAQSIAVQVQELAGSITDKLSEMDPDPELLQRLDDRLTLVEKLKRKYGPTLADVAATWKKHEERLHDLSTRTEQVERLQREIADVERELREKGRALSRQRAAAAGKLARALTKELRDLGFLQGGFDIALAACEPAATGMDEVSFGFAPNPGEAMRPLKAIASSGEIARVALAAKAVLATHDSIPVLVFDEIDSNIGGEVGRAVGQKLRRVAQTHQVICITHLPQSAVYGRHHFVVSKSVEAGRTKTHIRELEPESRVDEIARMLGGKGLTSVVEKHAKELLESAKE